MPSSRHESIKKMLIKASKRLVEKDSTPDLHHMRHLLEMSTFFYLLPWGVHYKKTKVQSGTHKIDADVIIPAESDRNKIILYFHGGGYTIGSSNSHRSLVGKLAKKTKTRALLIDYRKAPEHPYPAALEDALASYQSILKRGYLPQNVVFAGDSAGGGLVLSALMALRDKNKPLPAAGICLSPWCDLKATGQSIQTNQDNDPLIEPNKMYKWASMYATDNPLDDPYISPLYGDFTNLPPLLIQVSDSEMLFDDAVRVTRKARKQGVNVTYQSWEGLIHWWHLFQRVIPEACEAIDKIAEFIDEIFEQE